MDEEVRVEQREAVVIHAPGWFAREDFQQWRTRPAVATWSTGGGTTETEYQDVFMTFDLPPLRAGDDALYWEGSDVESDPDIPDDIKAEIASALRRLYPGGASGILWLQPV